MRAIDLFDQAVKHYSNVPAVIQGNISWTYQELSERSRRIANALLAQDLAPGSVVAGYSPNTPFGFAAELGTKRTAMIWVGINARNSIEENIRVLQKLKCEWLFYDTAFKEHIEPIRTAVPRLRGVVCLDADHGATPSVERWSASYGLAVPDIRQGYEDVISMMVTGGTTGEPKGVMHTNLNWLTVSATLVAASPRQKRPVHLVAAPLTHGAGWSAHAMLFHGGTQVLLAKPDPLSILEAIPRYGVTDIFLAPTMIYSMLAHPRLKDFDYSSLDYIWYGAAPMSVEKLKEAMEAFGPVLCQLFGQSEAPMTLGIMSPQEHLEALSNPELHHRLASTGRPGMLTVVEIMDEDGNLLPPGELGEIVCRGPIVMKGYFDDPAETEAASRFGWHHTGDIGRKDAAGYLFVTDRKKDLIITGGFNVYPGEVEQVIWRHPAVRDCAVIGIPDEHWGEAVTAVVELKDGHSVEPEEMIAFCKRQLGSVKAPKSVRLVESLPRSSVGKVLKRVLRDAFWDGYQRKI